MLPSLGYRRLARLPPELQSLTCPGRTLRPQSLLKATLSARRRRCVATAAYANDHAESLGDDERTGHIEAGPNEGILFFDNIFPLKLRWLVPLSISSDALLERLQHPSAAAFDPAGLLKRALPENLPVTITGVVPRLKEGGAFVKFSHNGSISVEEIETIVRKSLRGKIVRPWFNPFHRVTTHLVQGRPWVEDLYRPPTTRLRVEFLPPKEGTDAKDLTQEQLYSLFRPYGKLKEIESQPPDSKVLPRYAVLEFASTKRGIMAKNCLHGIPVKSETDPNISIARLKIGYEQNSRPGWIKDWLFNHPRIVIPLLAALAATFTVAVFDPIRTFNIKMHIKQSFHLKNYALWRWFASKVTRLVPLGHNRDKERGLNTLWDDRRQNNDQIETWLMDSANTFIVVQGPRGSGKRELVVDMALRNRKDKLIIDCKKIQEARGDGPTIAATAEQVGYRPIFSWMNSFSGLIDLAAQGATGMKTGFSETLDAQLNKILTNTATALREIALDDRNKHDKDADMSDDVYLESHPEKRPVVVIDNFLHKSQESSIIYDKIAEWAANCTSSNVAHVIFLTTDVSFSKSLGKALPDRVFRQISLGDCSPELARRFVLSHVEDDSASASGSHFMSKILSEGRDEEEQETKRPVARFDEGDLDRSVSLLGGRLTDLEFLARRIKAGETPSKAVREIIDQSASEILKIYILNANRTNGADPVRWTAEQAWTLIKGLATSEEGMLRYNQMLMDDNYKSAPGGPDSVLQALEQAEMIAITSNNGRPVAIKPGKPVFLHAFQQLASDKVLAARMEIGLLGEAAKGEAGTIAKCETELQLLGELPKQPIEIAGRIQYLLSKIEKSQKTIEQSEAETAKLKKLLSTEF